MRRGEEKELGAGGRRELFRYETNEFRNGKNRGSFPPHVALGPAGRRLSLILLGCSVLMCALCVAACGGGSAIGAPPPPPPPPSITVKVTPTSATVLLGNSAGFTASVSGTTDTVVSWAVNGIPGGNSAMGTISASGSYQAPAVLSSPANMQIVATSQADAQSSSSATVTVASDVQVQLSPRIASVALGTMQSFAATITSAGHPSMGISWSVAGPGCAGAACGSVAPDGTFTAPGILPAQPSVTVTATSVADPSKAASATVQLVNTHVLALSPTNATVALEQTESFAATLDGAPTTAVTWSVNGITGGNTAVGTISNSPSQNGLYFAPVNMPAGRAVTIAAVSNAYPALTSSVSLALISNIAVSINPASATRVPSARQTFVATVAQTSNPLVSWTVNGVTNGNGAAGQICIAGSNPCTAPPAAVQPGSIDYQAPASIPSPAQVTVAAVSVADPARFAAASVTITPQISVSISPASFTIPPQQITTLTATVLGVADQNVTWDVNGSIGGSIANGLICLPASSPCQAPNGPSAGPVEYRAPAAPPSPSIVSVRATSEAAPVAQGVALVTISKAPFITGLVPASVFAGAAAPFGLRVSGVQFAASAPGPGSAILINGAPRATTCPSATECDTTLDPAGLSAAGMLAVSIANADGTASNAVSLVVVPPQSTESVIALDASAPVAAGVDITVVEPTLAGGDSPGQLSLLEIGLVDPSTGACTLSSPPLVLVRPASGSAVVQVCALGTALDQITQIWFSSPAAVDLVATNADTALGSLILEFSVTVPAGAAPGARTLFAATTNQDQAALTCAVEVK